MVLFIYLFIYLFIWTHFRIFLSLILKYLIFDAFRILGGLSIIMKATPRIQLGVVPLFQSIISFCKFDGVLTSTSAKCVVVFPAVYLTGIVPNIVRVKATLSTMARRNHTFVERFYPICVFNAESTRTQTWAVKTKRPIKLPRK